jgi:hypothetical protein
MSVAAGDTYDAQNLIPDQLTGASTANRRSNHVERIFVILQPLSSLLARLAVPK